MCGRAGRLNTNNAGFRPLVPPPVWSTVYYYKMLLVPIYRTKRRFPARAVKYSRTERTRNNFERIVSLNNMESKLNGRMDAIVQENDAQTDALAERLAKLDEMQRRILQTLK